MNTEPVTELTWRGFSVPEATVTEEGGVYTLNGWDWEEEYPTLALAAERLGELVALDIQTYLDSSASGSFADEHFEFLRDRIGYTEARNWIDRSFVKVCADAGIRFSQYHSGGGIVLWEAEVTRTLPGGEQIGYRLWVDTDGGEYGTAPRCGFYPIQDDDEMNTYFFVTGEPGQPLDDAFGRQIVDTVAVLVAGLGGEQ